MGRYIAGGRPAGGGRALGSGCGRNCPRRRTGHAAAAAYPRKTQEPGARAEPPGDRLPVRVARTGPGSRGWCWPSGNRTRTWPRGIRRGVRGAWNSCRSSSASGSNRAGLSATRCEHAGITDRFVVLNGDIYVDFAFGPALEAHIARDADLTLALHREADPSSFGVAVCDPEGMVTGFVEKPLPGEAPSATW